MRNLTALRNSAVAERSGGRGGQISGGFARGPAAQRLIFLREIPEIFFYTRPSSRRRSARGTSIRQSECRGFSDREVARKTSRNSGWGGGG
jgi:hypothetical protein